jgi:hypothetical protein
MDEQTKTLLYNLAQGILDLLEENSGLQIENAELKLYKERREKMDAEHLQTQANAFGQTIDAASQKQYEIWAEGYADNGGYSGATLLGTMQGKNFKDACKKLANKDLAFGLYFDADTMTYWGCRLFDNEFEARKSFG